MQNNGRNSSLIEKNKTLKHLKHIVKRDTLCTQLAGQPDARRFKFVRHKGNYVRPLTLIPLLTETLVTILSSSKQQQA